MILILIFGPSVEGDQPIDYLIRSHTFESSMEHFVGRRLSQLNLHLVID